MGLLDIQYTNKHMKNSKHKKTAATFKLGLTVFILLGGVSNSGAAIIYFDDFSGAAGTDLHATIPDTRPGSEAWRANTFIDADGLTDAPAGGEGSSAWLPFVPTAGNVYSLSADFNVTAGNNDWLALGFSPNTGGTGFVLSENVSPWMLKRQDPEVQSFLGNNTNGAASHATGAGTINLKILLDTTPTLWTVDWKLNDVSVRTATFTTNPTIESVGFGAWSNALGTVDNFQLETIPEPSSAGLAVLAASGLLLRRNRRALRL